MVYDGHVASNSNTVDVYLVFVIVVDVSSQFNFQTRVLMCGTAIHTWNGI